MVGASTLCYTTCRGNCRLSVFFQKKRLFAYGEQTQFAASYGGPPGTRTLNQLIKSQLLYH